MRHPVRHARFGTRGAGGPDSIHAGRADCRRPAETNGSKCLKTIHGGEVGFIKTFRSKLIVCVISSFAVFFLLSFAAQSVYQSFRQTDFSEQETTIKRGCGKDSLSNRFFSKYNCSEGIIREDSEGEVLGGGDRENGKDRRCFTRKSKNG